MNEQNVNALMYDRSLITRVNSQEKELRNTLFEHILFETTWGIIVAHYIGPNTIYLHFVNHSEMSVLFTSWTECCKS